MGPKNKKDVVVSLAAAAVIALVVFGAVVSAKKKNTDITATSTTAGTAATTATPSESQTLDASTDAAADSVQQYKDGSYTATGTYSTPEDTESITVKVELKGGTVTDTSASASMKSRESKEYAAKFVNNYTQLVVGKKLSDIKLSRVSGSSLTSQGFNSAIEQIKSQAQS